MVLKTRSYLPAQWQRRLRCLGVLLALFSGLLSAVDAKAQVLNDDQVLAAIITAVVAHDLGIPIGLLPFPAAQYVAETAQYSGNLALKGIRPWLKRPDDFDVSRHPGQDNDGDRCSYTFYLPNSQATYENMFGIIPIPAPYYDEKTNTLFSWRDRWGILGTPRLYHANTAVRLSVRSANSVRRYSEADGAFVQFPLSDDEPTVFTDTYFPILDQYDPQTGMPSVFGVEQPARADKDGRDAEEGPQQVYLPIGEHTMEWTAATQLNTITDIVVPGVLLALAVHSEVKTATGGMSAAKTVKSTGIGDDIVDAAASAGDVTKATKAKGKFTRIWEHYFTKKGQGPINKLVVSAAVKKFRGILADLIDTGIGLGVDVLHAETGALLQAQGSIGRLESEQLQMIHKVAVQQKRAVGMVALKALIAGSDSDDSNSFIAGVVVALLQTWGLDDYVTFDTGVSTIGQTVTIWDNVPPELAIDQEPVVLEATDFGGTRRYRAAEQLHAHALAGASDNCGRVPVLTSDAPELLPIGELTVTWTATDKGPNPPDGQDYAPQGTQRLSIRDTQPPLLLAPPSKVIEANADLSLADAAIGDAAAVDLADVQPVIANNAPDVFLLDRRNEVQWTATDHSGNAAESSQWVTVKTEGSNTAPVADDNSATTLTAEPVDIRLTAHDADELDGMPDPLWFGIEQQPQRGEFIAPLYPFFISDYRTRPNDGLGDDFDPVTDDLREYIATKYCIPDPQLVPPVEFAHNVRFVHVTDDGTRFLLDQHWACGLSDETIESHRFSKWDADGNFLGQMRISGGPEDVPWNESFVIDRDGFLYYNQHLSPAGSSAEMILMRCSTDFTGPGGLPDTDTTAKCSQSYRADGSSTPGGELEARTLSYIRIDSGNGVAYVVDGDGVLAFELLDGSQTRFIGESGPMVDGELVVDWLGASPALEVGADGSLYVADRGHHRVHKIGPVGRDEDGNFVAGEYVGWSGRCTASGNKACDEERERSRGYSCTYDSDSCTVAPGDRAGDAQGQFDTPAYIAIDPNDVLYVADYENERVQRLSPDGSFAGEAVSDGSGINKGERPSFVLGNMGKPESLSVNSTQFFVVDRDEQFVHVFGTLPFKDITSDAATVTYVSDQDFHGAVDEFTFSVTDGLVDSAPATVSITVNRNHRAPVALAGTEITPEDTPLEFTLQADDPDGILGEDFNGLDTLTYTMTAPPAHGAVSGSGADWIYTPEPDFYGEDTLRFQVNDGLFTSDEAAVTFTVTPVNDPPVVTIEVPERVALGFPILVTSSFTDDPSEDYEARVDWDDGGTATTGSITDDGETPRIEGVAVSAPPLPEIEGRTFSQHVFEAVGPREIEVCVTDSDGLEACDSAVVVVESLVSLGIGSSVYAEPLADDDVTQQQIDDHQDFTYELSIVNAEPSVGPGRLAADVVLVAELPADLPLGAITVSHGSCTRAALELVCELGDLAPGEEVTLTVAAFGPGNLIYDEYRDFEGSLSTSTPAVEPDVSFLASTELLSDSTDSDGDGMSDAFENAYGLDPSLLDGDDDADNDGLTNLEEYEFGTSPLEKDSDGDGLADFEEATGGITDPANADTDDDGMPDGWEVENGLEPGNGSDAGEDADGDGLTNLEEFEQGNDPQRDDIPPVLAIPADININATGTLTAVAVGTATAEDGKDGTVAAVADRTSPFAPGAHVITWSATDDAGNLAEGLQRVNVTPIVSFAVDQTVPEGVLAQVAIELNGPAVEYPVTVPYTVSGTAQNPGDHDASAGTASIESGIGVALPIAIVEDLIFEPDEVLVLTMGTPANAVPGEKTGHTITIHEPNAAPEVTIRIEQQGHPVATAFADGGALAITASVYDNPGDAHSVDWSASDSMLLDPLTAQDAGYILDATGLSAGLHRLRVQVSDDANPAAVAEVGTLLKVLAGAPALSPDEDTDGDGISDADEGYADSDGDRVADYLDDLPNANMLRLADDGRVLETNTGLGLRLGERAFSSDRIFAEMSEEDVGEDIPEDVDYGYPNRLVDFEVTGLPSGGAAQVVLPLQHPVSADAVYRKYANGTWRDFVVDAANRMASAAGVDGGCPPPTSPEYAPGLTPGDMCLQLTLQDGGPNDADGRANTIIQDPGGLGMPVSVSLEILPTPDRAADVTGSRTVMMRLRLHSDSGDAELRFIRLRAAGSGDDRGISHVQLVADVNANGVWDDGETVAGTGRYHADNGALEIALTDVIEIESGSVDFLVVYEMD